VIGVTFVLFVVTGDPFKLSFPNTLPATAVVPEANGADTVSNVSSVALILTHYILPLPWMMYNSMETHWRHWLYPTDSQIVWVTM
jgi:hypothetical protein